MVAKLKAPEDRVKNHPLFKTWRNMRGRCEDPAHISFPNYGARGISVCERWRKFRNFADDMGARPEGHSLERVNNAGNYERKNCRWASVADQKRNTKRNVFLTAGGFTLCQKDWSEKLRASEMTIRRHLRSDGVQSTQNWIAERLEKMASGAPIPWAKVS